MSVQVLSKPKHTLTNLSVVEYLIRETTHCDKLFLPVSQRLQKPLEELCEGISYLEFLNELKKHRLVPVSFAFWQSSLGPILKLLPQIQKLKGFSFYCYKDPDYSKFSNEAIIKIATLILKGAINGNLEIEKIKKIIQQDLEKEEQALEREADFLIDTVERNEEDICIASLDGIYFASRFNSEGYKTILVFLGISFINSPTPLTLLRQGMKQGNITDSEIERLILSQIKLFKERGLLPDSPKRAHKIIENIKKLFIQ